MDKVRFVALIRHYSGTLSDISLVSESAFGSSFMSSISSRALALASSRLWTLRSFPADGPAADADELVQLFVGLAQTLLHLGEALPELVELRFHRAQQLPDLAGALLDGEGLEAHLQAVQQGRHGAGACHVDLIVPLQDLQQPRVHHLGIQALKGQEQDAERRGIGRLDVLFPDVSGLAAEHQLEGVAGILHGLRVAGSVGVL